MRSALLLALLALPALALAQGSLTPPGAPAPSMKTLDQVEPRIPLPAGRDLGVIRIEDPGSYYLTGDVTVIKGTAIQILASNVTLDLNGFTLMSEAIADADRGFGILLVEGAVNATVRNGHIHGWVARQNDGTFTGPGFLYGLFAGWTSTTTAALGGVTVEDVTVEGIYHSGIFIGGLEGQIRHCTASNCGSEGIRATTVTDSSAVDCGQSGIRAETVVNCRAIGLTNPGIDAKTVVASYGQSTKGHGIHASTVTGSYGESVTGCGIRSSIANSCYGVSTDADGINATSVTASYGYSPNGYGIYATEAADSGGATASGSYGLHAVYTAQNCAGYSTSGGGLYAENATNCYGVTVNGARGLCANQTATGCHGRIMIATGASAPRLDAAQPRALSAGTATNCTGIVDSASGTSFGLFAGSAANCRGLVTASQNSNADRPACGLHAEQSASDSYGNCPSGYGLEAGTADNCTGESQTGTGLAAANTSNCTGQTSSGSYGLNANDNATNCTGLNSTGSFGLRAGGTASFCRGSRPGGTALQASIAVACTAISGAISAPSKQLGTP